MSKRMLLALSMLSGVCMAEDAVDLASAVVAPVDSSSGNVQDAHPATADETSVQQTATELPGVRIDSGPVSITPSAAITEQNITALAEVAVEALEQTLQEAAAHIEASIEKEADIIIEEVTQSFIEFLMTYYGQFIEFLKNGWKFMIYHSMSGATRHIVQSASARSVVLDLSSLEAVDGFAAECLAKMEAAKAVIVAAAEAKSPQLKIAADVCLSQYADWFTGRAGAFVSDASTSEMLKSLGLVGVDPREFNVRHIQRFYARGGEARHRSLYFEIAPSEASGLLGRSMSEEDFSDDAASQAEVEAAQVEDSVAVDVVQSSDQSVVADVVQDEVIVNDSSVDQSAVQDDEAAETPDGKIDELIEQIEELQQEVSDIEELLIEELDDDLSSVSGQ